jgi:hypothetical protein
MEPNWFATLIPSRPSGFSCSRVELPLLTHALQKHIRHARAVICRAAVPGRSPCALLSLAQGVALPSFPPAATPSESAYHRRWQNASAPHLRTRQSNSAWTFAFASPRHTRPPQLSRGPWSARTWAISISSTSSSQCRLARVLLTRLLHASRMPAQRSRQPLRAPAPPVPCCSPPSKPGAILWCCLRAPAPPKLLLCRAANSHAGPSTCRATTCHGLVHTPPVPAHSFCVCTARRLDPLCSAYSSACCSTRCLAQRPLVLHQPACGAPSLGPPRTRLPSAGACLRRNRPPEPLPPVVGRAARSARLLLPSSHAHLAPSARQLHAHLRRACRGPRARAAAAPRLRLRRRLPRARPGHRSAPAPASRAPAWGRSPARPRLAWGYSPCALRRRPAPAPAAAAAAGEEKRRGARKKGKTERERKTLAVRRKKKGRLDKGEQRRRTDGISQGLMLNFRKLQGPFCKAKFSH